MANSDPAAASLEQIKSRLRQSMKSLRSDAHQDDQKKPLRDRAGYHATAHFFQRSGIEPHINVAAYWPMETEFDPRPLMVELHKRGHGVALPVTHGAGRPLTFKRWHPDLSLIPGAYKIPTPPAEAQDIEPHLIFVPLLAFDKRGYRLGYGGGYYDRTLSLMRSHRPEVEAIGLAWEVQLLPEVPHGLHDVKLDAVLTESRFQRLTPLKA